MPINKYYGGHGEEVMANMTKEYGPEKGKRVFYATQNKIKSQLPKGVSQSPQGDIGQHRGVEAKIAGAFRGSKIMSTAKYFKGA